MVNWLRLPVKSPDIDFYSKAMERQKQLTKPLGSLGRMEEVAIRLAAMQKTLRPEIERVWVSVFAADHGVAEESVSAFPQSVTTEMVRNFVNEGAAVNVLSRYVNAHFEVVDVGLLRSTPLNGVIVEKIGNGTRNFTKQCAMTELQMEKALHVGRKAVIRSMKQNTQLFIGGEMGIANTTSASAIAVVITKFSIADLTGAGTGLGVEGIQKKAKVIQKAVDFHQKHFNSPLKVLQCLGGFEITALVGAYIYAAQQGIAVLIDGFISTVAALVALKVNSQVHEWFFYAHQSQEKGHKLVLEYLKAKPLLDLHLRLGEGSGAVTAVPILQMACNLHNEMATFEQAKITKN